MQSTTQQPQLSLFDITIALRAVNAHLYLCKTSIYHGDFDHETVNSAMFDLWKRIEEIKNEVEKHRIIEFRSKQNETNKKGNARCGNNA